MSFVYVPCFPFHFYCSRTLSLCLFFPSPRFSGSIQQFTFQFQCVCALNEFYLTNAKREKSDKTKWLDVDGFVHCTVQYSAAQSTNDKNDTIIGYLCVCVCLSTLSLWKCVYNGYLRFLSLCTHKKRLIENVVSLLMIAVQSKRSLCAGTWYKSIKRNATLIGSASM